LAKLPEFNDKEIQNIMGSIDTDKSGKIDYTGREPHLSNLRILGCNYGKKCVLERRKAIYGFQDV
jgi:hypothetical protein